MPSLWSWAQLCGHLCVTCPRRKACGEYLGKHFPSHPGKTLSEKREAAIGSARGDPGGASVNPDQGEGAGHPQGEDQGVQRALGRVGLRERGVADLQSRNGATILLWPVHPTRPGQLHAAASQVSSNIDFLTQGCDIIFLCRGRVHRQTWVDKKFSGVPHMVELSQVTLWTCFIPGLSHHANPSKE